MSCSWVPSTATLAAVREDRPVTVDDLRTAAAALAEGEDEDETDTDLRYVG